MRGVTNALPAGSGLRVIASGTAEGGQTVTFPEPVKIVFVSRDNNGGSWVPGGQDTVPLIVFAPAKAMANSTDGHRYSAQLVDEQTISFTDWDETGVLFGYLALG